MTQSYNVSVSLLSRTFLAIVFLCIQGQGQSGEIDFFYRDHTPDNVRFLNSDKVDLYLLGEAHLGANVRNSQPEFYKAATDFITANSGKRKAEIKEMLKKSNPDGRRPVVVLYEAISYGAIKIGELDREIIQENQFPDFESEDQEKKFIVKGWDNDFLSHNVIQKISTTATSAAENVLVTRNLMMGLRNFLILTSIARAQKDFDNPVIFVIAGGIHVYDPSLLRALERKKINYRAKLSVPAFSFIASAVHQGYFEIFYGRDAKSGSDFFTKKVAPYIFEVEVPKTSAFYNDFIDLKTLYPEALRYLANEGYLK